MKKNTVITFILYVLLSSVSASIEEGDLAELQCWIYASYGIFKLTSLEKMDKLDYSIDITTKEESADGTVVTLTYNFCTFTQYKKMKTYAYLTTEKANHTNI